jgi:hypothetical protein
MRIIVYSPRGSVYHMLRLRAYPVSGPSLPAF